MCAPTARAERSSQLRQATILCGRCHIQPVSVLRDGTMIFLPRRDFSVLFPRSAQPWTARRSQSPYAPSAWDFVREFALLRDLESGQHTSPKFPEFCEVHSRQQPIPQQRLALLPSMFAAIPRPNPIASRHLTSHGQSTIFLPKFQSGHGKTKSLYREAHEERPRRALRDSC